MKVLVVAAHPDDEVYGMGGTMAKLAAQGHEVHVLIVTDGCTAQYADRPDLPRIIKRKRDEALEANQLLGVQQVHFGIFPDMRLDTVPHVEVNRLIEETVDAVQPKAVYTHFYGDVNLDHQMVYRSTLVAVRPVPGQCVRELYCYRVPSSTEWSPQLGHTVFLPNVMTDISGFEDVKERALLAYQTEARAYPHPRSPRYIRETDQARGLEWGLGPAEAFWLLRKIKGAYHEKTHMDHTTMP
ncbi:MAG: PIG-L family deacetylase [Lachnospiraceae bacterium]|nr:PIG-L family deacetylase [Lachnospiraceae bacterium]